MTDQPLIDPLVTTSLPCTVHNEHHRPKPRLNHRHHVWPLGWGGPRTPDNIVVVCPTGHANIHHLLAEYVALRGEVPYTIIRRYSHGERKLAKLGWERAQRKAM